MFNVLPDNFFVPLASPNKIIYWECIARLFSVMEHQLSFGVEREVLADELEYYFGQSMAAEPKDDEFAKGDNRAKANEMLRNLEKYGWIEIETDKSYVQRVNFKDYSVRLIKTLLEISEGKQVEYQGYIYTIYSLVRTKTDNPAVELLQIVDNTDMLITGLKNLNSNIKHYIDELTRHSTVQEILDALFNDYITNIVDKAYHRLLTSDNVSKFRPEIIERLESKSRSGAYIAKTSGLLAQMQEITVEDAAVRVYDYLHSVIEAFRSMDDILEEINLKNTQYQRAAINRAKFLLAGNEDARGQLKEILIEVGERMNAENMDPSGIYEIEFLDDMIRVYGSSFLDERSLYTPVEWKKKFEPGSIGRNKPDPAVREEKLRRMREKLDRDLTVSRIEAYVLEHLKGKDSMRACQLPLETVEDFVKIIYVRLYGQRKNVKYRISVMEECTVGGFRFRDFLIERK